MRNRLARALPWWSAALATVTTGLAADVPQDSHATPPHYAYATNGVLDLGQNARGEKWKLLLNETNLGGPELEAAELTLPAGTTVRSHTHRAVEVIYVLSGTYGHEVNGHLYLLKPGSMGIVRPGDKVRHLVPKDGGEAKLLILWTPAGEAARVFRSQGKGGVTPEPVPEVSMPAR